LKTFGIITGTFWILLM